MDYYCSTCDKYIKLKSKYKHFKSETHNEFDRCKHEVIANTNPNIDKIDELFCAYIIEHNKKFDHFFVRCQFKLVFNDNYYSTVVQSD